MILSDPFHITKTTIFAILLTINNGFSNDFISEIHSAIDEFNKNKVITIIYTKEKPETGAEAEVRYQRQLDEAKDVELNKREIREGRYWVDGRWIIK